MVVDVLVAVGRLLGALALVALNGFFVASEFALVRVRSTAVDRMAEEGLAGSAALETALDQLDDYLAATQLGITVASLGLGWIGEPAVAALIEPSLGPVLPDGTSHIVAVAIGFAVVTFLHVVFGELAPKTIAIAEAEKLARLIAPPMRLFYYLFYPGLVVFNGTANAFTGLIGVPPASETEETLTEDEIRLVLGRAGREGDLDADEVEMIERVFELDDVAARDVMIPRPEVESVPASASLAELRRTAIEAGHTRYPVVDRDGDEPLGYVDVKDLLAAADDDDVGADATAADLARDLPIVPQTARVDELLRTFQDEQRQMAAVVDEFGELEGIATVEDAVEVVVGDIRDEFDDDAPGGELRRRGDGSVVADGTLPIRRVNEELDADFAAETAGTIGGLVVEALGRLPDAGDSVVDAGYELEAAAVDDGRVETVLLRSAPEDDADAAAEG